MAKVVVKQKTKKIKKKFPVEFIAPELFNSKSLGHTQISDLNKTIGKNITLNMMYIAESVKFQNIRLTFKVTSIDSGKAQTQIAKYEQVPYFLSRFVKKDSNLIEVNQVIITKDNFEVIVKMFIVTKNHVSQLVLGQIRHQAKKLIEEEAKHVVYSDLMGGIIYSKYQQKLRNDLKSITPIKVFEFKKTELINNNE